MITAKSSFVEEKYTAQYYSGNGCLYVSGAGGVLKGGIHDLTGNSGKCKKWIGICGRGRENP